MSSANEVAKTTESETAPAVVTLHTLRNEDGSVAAGTVFFDVNYRMPGATTFTGLHIHDAPAGVNGGITIPMVPTFDPNFTSDTGFGNYWNYTPGVLNLADPRRHHAESRNPLRQHPHLQGSGRRGSRSACAPPFRVPAP